MDLNKLNEEISALETRSVAGEDVEKELIAKNFAFTKLAEQEKSKAERKKLMAELATVEVGKTEKEKISEGQIWKSDSHFLHDIYTAGRHCENESETLKKYAKTVGSDEQAVTPDPDGGYTVPTQISSKLVERILNKGVVKNRCFNIPVSVPRLSLPAVNDKTEKNETFFGGIKVYYKAERAALTVSKGEFRKIDLTCHKLTALVPVTNELLKFSPISIAAWLSVKVPVAIAAKETKMFLFGSGAGEPKGALVGVDKLGVNRGTASTVKYADLCNMWARAYNKNGGNWCWYANDTVLPQLMQLSFEGTSSSVAPSGWSPYIPAGVMGQATDTLLGKPVFYTSYCSALGTAKDLCLCNMEDYYVAEAGGLESAVSIHLRFDYDESCYRWTLEHDGQSSWDAVFTPENGNTLSPYIYLTHGE